MKKIIAIILLLLTLECQVLAQDKNSAPSQTVGLHFILKTPAPSNVHRAPVNININTSYNAENNSIDISYVGEDDGEIFIYMNDDIVGYSSELNTSIQLPSSTGHYRLEIVSETWIAQGHLQL